MCSVRFAVWFLLRKCLVVVGTAQVNMEKSHVVFPRADKDAVLAGVTGYCFGEHGTGAGVQSWSHHTKALFCITSGSDTCEVSSTQLRIRKESGIIGIHLGIDTLQQ